jgi:AbrB family looped-hinge helix DNA binding protein
MTLQIDKAGRIVLPKRIRDRLGLHPGSDLELEETAGGVFLKVPVQTPPLIEKDGFLVYTGALPPGFDVLRAIDQDREERARKLWGR